MSLTAKTKQTIAEHDLIAPGDSVLIALSGGPDSVALLRLLVSLKKSFKLSVSAVYVNHALRPKAARVEERFCQELCDNHGVDLTIAREDIRKLARDQKTGVEETARRFRYGLFEQIANDDNHDRIALGHHADDQAETILFRIIRGTGVEGLTGIPIKRGRIIRPLLHCTKEDIQTYLKRIKQPFCEDRSNRSLDYSRNFIRNRLLPQIRERLNPQVDSSLTSLGELAVVESAHLDSQVSRAARKVIEVSPGGKIALDLSRARTYDKWLRLRLLRRCVKAVSLSGMPPDRKVIERLDLMVTTDGRSISIPGLIQATIVDDKLLFYARTKQRFNETLTPGRSLKLEWPRLTFSSRLYERSEVELVRERRAATVLLDWDQLVSPLTVRNIRPGERFRPLGLKGSRKVGDYLTDRKVPQGMRDEIPLLCDKNGIVWLVGYEIADRVKITRKTGKVLSVGYRRRKTGKSNQV